MVYFFKFFNYSKKFPNFSPSFIPSTQELVDNATEGDLQAKVVLCSASFEKKNICNNFKALKLTPLE